MKTVFQLFFGFLILFGIFGCVAMKKEAAAREVLRDHKTVAILPPFVSYSSSKFKSDIDQINEETEYSIQFQEKLHAKMLKKMKIQQVDFKLQKLNNTNTLLEKAGYFGDKEYSYQELFNILNVDGILFTEFTIDEIEGLLSGCLFPSFTHRNKNISLYLEIMSRDKEDPVYQWEQNMAKDNERYPTKWMIRDLIRITVNSLPYFEFQAIR